MSSSHTVKVTVAVALGDVRDWDGLARQAKYRAGELAGICQISLRTLERHFRKQYNLKVGRWLKELRMSDAYQKLQQGDSVKEVAFDLGYKQHSHFSRDFKNRFGVSPSFRLPLIAYTKSSGTRSRHPATIPSLGSR